MGGRGRGDTQDGHKARRAGQGAQRRLVGMAVQNELGAMGGQDVPQSLAILQGLAGGDYAGDRRMMQHHHAKMPAGRKAWQQLGQPRQLALPESAGGQPGRRRHGAAEIDNGDMPPDPDMGKGRGRFIGQPGTPGGESIALGPADQGVMIARADRHLAKGAKAAQPSLGGCDFSGCGEVGQIAGDGDVVRRPGAYIGHQGVENRLVVLSPLSSPGDGAERPLGHEVPQTQRALGRR